MHESRALNHQGRQSGQELYGSELLAAAASSMGVPEARQGASCQRCGVFLNLESARLR